MADFFVRELDPLLGQAVANRTYLRKDENWGQLSERVALGNTLLHPTGKDDYIPVRNGIASGRLLVAGRHYQHGDIDQPYRNMEVYTNCSTAPLSFLKFLLLLNGSGVGRNYSDDQMIVDWRNMPILNCILSTKHDDYNSKYQLDNDIKVLAKEGFPFKAHHYHLVEDSREGWAKALEILEVATYEKKNKNSRFIFDFSDIRKSGMPIKGMQNRPASGPIPLIYAFQQIAKVKQLDIMPWEQAMFIDHYASECVANGGARRSARIAIKYWKDPEIFKFITIKRDNPWMWSSNNSIGVDKEFWKDASKPNTHANCVFMAATENSFGAGGGEPGFVSLDKLTVKD
jgi:ribonucleoside-triphosphate reductase (formate)